MKQLVLSILLMFLPLMAYADPVEINGIYYNLEIIEKANLYKAEVAQNPNKYSGDVVIPKSVEFEGKTYLVTSIGDAAFLDCNGLTSISIPNSVTKIGSGAFYDCKNINSVLIEDLEGWCNIVFADNYSILEDGSSLYQRYNNPLYFAKKLYVNGEEIKDLVIPNSVTSLKDCAFIGFDGLTSVTIPEGVTSIGKAAFQSCSCLTSVTIPKSMTFIDGYAFGNCSALTSVNISDIAAWCNIEFSGHYETSSNPLSYAHHLFFNGNEIKNLVIPNEIISINNYAFQNCSGLTSVTIPNSISSIGMCAFYGCSGLTSLTIPNSVTTINYQAFYGCSSIPSITIPNSVTSIGGRAFNGCEDLSTIIIGSGVKTIEEGVFSNCKKIKDVYCMAEELSAQDNWGRVSFYTNSSAFDGSYIEYATLYVPESAINTYKAITPWSGFGKFLILSGEAVETPKCATPTISLNNGKIKFSCQTEGVEFVSIITSTDTKNYYEGEITPTYKYKISVYATKNGYDNSDTVTAEFTASGKFGDLNKDGKVNVADHVELTKIIMGESQE